MFKNGSNKFIYFDNNPQDNSNVNLHTPFQQGPMYNTNSQKIFFDETIKKKPTNELTFFAQNQKPSLKPPEISYSFSNNLENNNTHNEKNLQEKPENEYISPKTISKEFEDLIKEKFGKIDEILNYLKQKQTLIKDDPLIELPLARDPIIKEEKKVLFKEIGKKTVDEIKTNKYEVVDDDEEIDPVDDLEFVNLTNKQFEKFKKAFPEFPRSYRHKLFTDGSVFFVELAGKKVVVDDKVITRINTIVNNLLKPKLKKK